MIGTIESDDNDGGPLKMCYDFKVVLEGYRRCPNSHDPNDGLNFDSEKNICENPLGPA